MGTTGTVGGVLPLAQRRRAVEVSVVLRAAVVIGTVAAFAFAAKTMIATAQNLLRMVMVLTVAMT